MSLLGSLLGSRLACYFATFPASAQKPEIYRLTLNLQRFCLCFFNKCFLNWDLLRGLFWTDLEDNLEVYFGITFGILGGVTFEIILGAILHVILNAILVSFLVSPRCLHY